jgi:putative redox protein
MEHQVFPPVAAALENATVVEVAFVAGESYEALVRGHRIAVDQPAGSGGNDSAPTPVELFVASLATCVAFYAGGYLTRHRYGRDGLTVTASFAMASDHPARVSDIRVTIGVPACVSARHRAALRAVARHCTVHNTLISEPSIMIELD